MTKLVISLVALLPCLATTSTIQEHFAHVPMKNIIESITRTCARKTGATKAEVQLLHDYDKLSTTRASKCMIACVLYSFGSLNEADDSKDNINLDLYFTFAFKPEEHAIVSAFWETCYTKEPHDPDHCEYVFSIIKCYTTAVREAKITPIPFWDVY